MPQDGGFQRRFGYTKDNAANFTPFIPAVGCVMVMRLRYHLFDQLPGNITFVISAFVEVNRSMTCGGLPLR